MFTTSGGIRHFAVIVTVYRLDSFFILFLALIFVYPAIVVIQSRLCRRHVTLVCIVIPTWYTHQFQRPALIRRFITRTVTPNPRLPSVDMPRAIFQVRRYFQRNNKRILFLFPFELFQRDFQEHPPTNVSILPTAYLVYIFFWSKFRVPAECIHIHHTCFLATFKMLCILTVESTSIMTLEKYFFIFIARYTFNRAIFSKNNNIFSFCVPSSSRCSGRCTPLAFCLLLCTVVLIPPILTYLPYVT